MKKHKKTLQVTEQVSGIFRLHLTLFRHMYVCVCQGRFLRKMYSTKNKTMPILPIIQLKSV